MERAKGYHYVMGADGKKHRVYPKKKNVVRGKGAYGVSRARALYGRGGYYDSNFVKGMNKYVPKGTFSSIGKAVGGPLGGLAGHALSALAGFGAYKIKSNSVMLDEGVSPPSMHSTNSAMRVRHREYVCDIVSSSSANTFTNLSFPIQPGLPTAYPWLSAIASQYQEHKPLGIVYEFKTLSATAISSATNTTMGGIIMATDYNAINAAFVNKQQMDNTEYTTSGPVWQSFFHPIECDPRTNPISSLYVRPGAAPSGSDLRLYDLGLFQIASFGVQGTSVVLGELWVTYEWQFDKPISTSALGQDVLSDHFQLTSVTNAAPLGATQTSPVAGSSIGGSHTGTVYSFPAVFQEGTYMVNYHVVGTAAAVTHPAITLANCSFVKLWDADTNNFQQAPQNGGTASVAMLSFVVSLTAQSATITFGAGTLPSSATSADLFITQIDSNIVT